MKQYKSGIIPRCPVCNSTDLIVQIEHGISDGRYCKKCHSDFYEKECYMPTYKNDEQYKYLVDKCLDWCGYDHNPKGIPQTIEELYDFYLNMQDVERREEAYLSWWNDQIEIGKKKFGVTNDNPK